MPKKNTKREEEEEDSDCEEDEQNEAQDEEKPHKPAGFNLMRSAKLAMFTFVMFVLVMSDVFVLRVMDRAGMDLVLGRAATKKGMVVQGLLIAMSLIVLDFLIAKEKL